MDKSKKCFATLNRLIAAPGTAGIPLAEKLVDQLLETADTNQTRSDLLLDLQTNLFSIAKKGSREQAEFIKLVDDFIDFRMRQLRARKRKTMIHLS
jgi:hypothetical protein